MRRAIYTFLYFFIYHASAETLMVSVNGHDLGIDLAVASNQLVKAFQSKGIRVEQISNDPSNHQGYPPPVQVNDKIQLELYFQELGKKLKTQSEVKTILINISAHGSRTNNFSKPQDGGIILSATDLGITAVNSKLVSYEELQEMIRKHLPSKINIKLFGYQCYGGGSHQISFNRPGTCSSSASDFRTATRVSTKLARWENNKFVKEKPSHGLLYTDGISKAINDGLIDLNDDKKMNLYELHAAAKYRDIINGTGKISSLDYIDSVLKKGAYNQEDQNQDLSIYIHKLSSILAFRKFIPPSRQNFVFQDSGLDCNESIITDQFIDLENVIEKMNRKNFIDLPINDQYKRHLLENFDNLIKDISSIEAKLKSYFTQYQSLKKQWEELGFLEKRKQKAKTVTLLEELEDQFIRDNYILSQSIDRLNEMNNITEFWNKSTTDQKDNFKRLVECEWENF